MHEAAVAIGQTQQADYLLGEIDTDDEHQQLSGQA
jgi:predicted metal-binding protein